MYLKGYILAVFIILLFLIPLMIRDIYTLHILNMIGIYILLVSGLNLVMGYAGQVHIGQAGFYAIGAYTSALLALNLKLSFWLALPAAGVVAGIFGLLVGPVSRLPPYALAMATIAFGEIVYVVALNWVGLTRGASGLLNIPPPRIGSFTFSSDRSFYYLILISVLGNYFIIGRLIRSRVGRALRAIRDNERAALASGIHVARYKTVAFALAALFAGIAGSLYAHLTGFISPYGFDLNESLKIFTMMVIGGSGSIFGPILGVAALTVAPEYLRGFQEYNLLLYGFVLLLVLMFAPEGLDGLVSWLRRRLAPI